MFDGVFIIALEIFTMNLNMFNLFVLLDDLFGLLKVELPNE